MREVRCFIGVLSVITSKCEVGEDTRVFVRGDANVGVGLIPITEMVMVEGKECIWREGERVGRSQCIGDGVASLIPCLTIFLFINACFGPLTWGTYIDSWRNRSWKSAVMTALFSIVKRPLSSIQVPEHSFYSNLLLRSPQDWLTTCSSSIRPAEVPPPLLLA